MGFFDRLYNGTTDFVGGIAGGARDVVSGPVDFIADGFQAAQTLGSEGPTEALGVVINSFQEEILGQMMGGLFGPEGIGGTIIGALPQDVRSGASTVIDPVMGGWDWVIQEGVDRPLGTLFTVIDATSESGVGALIDPSIYARAWEINDKRTFGQSFAASLMYIDPFNEDEYNAIKDSPVFNLISGTADFQQEFIDPVTIIGGTAIKGARGGAVLARSAGRGGRGALIGAPREITRVYGGRTGLRPQQRASLPHWLTKTDQQMDNRNAIIQNRNQQRTAAFIESKDYGRIESAMSKFDNVDDRFTAFKQTTGKAGRRMSDDAIRLYANAETPQARARTMRALSGDFTVLDEVSKNAAELREIMQSEGWGEITKALHDPKLGDAAGAARFREVAEQTDWAVMKQFQESLISSQQIYLDFDAGTGRYLGSNKASTFAEIAAENTDSTLAALESIAAAGEDMYGSVFGMAQTPWGNRITNMLRQHNKALEETANGWVISQFANPHTVGGALGGPIGKGIRVLSERVPQSVIFFTDSSAVRQFERVMTQAARINIGGVTIVDAQEAGRLTASFQALKMQGDTAGMATLYENTVRTLNNRLDDALEASDIAGIDKTKRALTDSYDETTLAWNIEKEKARAVGVTESGEEMSVTVRRDVETGEETVVHHRMSPSQVKSSMVQPRYDVIQRQIELAEARTGTVGQRVKVKIGDTVRGEMARFRPVVDTPQHAWRAGMLLRPAWPIRVGIDEQMRAMADLGALTALGNLATSMPEMRRAFAVHNLENIGEATDVEALARIMADRQGLSVADEIEDLTRQLDEQLEEYGRVTDMPEDVGQLRTEMIQRRMQLRRQGEPTLLDLIEAAGPEGLDSAVKQLVREKVLAYRNEAGKRRNLRKLGSNAAVKGTAFGLFMGNPVAGAIYGMVAYGSKRYHINKALERKAALNYAGALRNEAELMLRQVTTADGGDLATIRKMQSDAAYIEDLVQREIDGASTIRNGFDTAEELMEKAGVAGVHIGGISFRNAFGDDPRYQEQIRANVSASRAQSAIYSGARRDATRQIEKFVDTDWRAFDAVTDGDISQQWERMMNQYTSRDIDQEFYQIVWSNETVEVRQQKLAALLEGDEQLMRALTDLPSGMIDEGYETVARQVINEYENVLPSGQFGQPGGLRERARAGEIVPWSEVKAHLMSPEAGFTKGKSLKTRIEETRQAGYPDFGKATSPDPKTHAGSTRRSLGGGNLDSKVEGLFTMLGTLPTDELSRNPMFRVKYERELRRRVELLADDDGVVRVSQRTIDEMEQQARDAALAEVRELMYDLAENTRISEMVGNAMPFFNAWQEVIGRWSGLAVENPTFVGNAMRLYRKPWEAEALGISQVSTEDAEGNVTGTYLVFRPFGSAYDEDGNETTIFEALPPGLRDQFFPKPLRDADQSIRFSKDGLNTVVQAPVPGFGPLITIPVREAILADPTLEETFQFMFPFGHPEGGFLERTFKNNLPTWAASMIDYGFDTETKQRVVARMFQDITVQRAAAGEPLDWNNELEVNAALDLAHERAKQFFIFRGATGAFSPASTTLLSPYEPLVQEARKLQREHGTLIGNDMFLEKYGEDFFALTARMTKLNDGVAASVDAEENYLRHQDLVQAHPEVGAWISGSVGAADEQMVFSQAVYRRQQNMELAPGSRQTRRERKTPQEAIGDTQADLGWRAYTELRDFVRNKQEEAIAAGLSGSLNAAHFESLRGYQEQVKAELALQYPQWAEQERDFTRSARRMKSVVDGFAAGLQDPQLLQRPSSVHLLEYFELRMFVQRELQARDAAGGSADLSARSNESLLSYWETEKAKLGMRPQFSALYDRFFERDRLDAASFAEDDAFEGLL